MPTIALLMLLGVLGNTTATPVVTDQVPMLIETQKSSDTAADTNVEAQVRDYFKDTPILAEVARCESHFTQFTDSGKVLRGKVTPADIGVMQINENYHGAEAKKLGLDIYTLEGNMAFAKYLYSKNGTKDWFPSSKCWSGKLTDKTANNTFPNS